MANERLVVKKRRVIKLGDALVITLPQEFVKLHELKPKDEVGVVANHILQVVAMPKKEG